MDQETSSRTSELMLKKKQTFARRVSDMFKDGAKSGPPLLFRHSSMQKIRHCCQNLNLLPYLLYSFDHSKSHPIAVKVNIYLNIMVKHLLQNMILLYAKLQWSILRSLSSESKIAPKEGARPEKKERVSRSSFQQEVVAKPKQRNTPLYLVLVIYLAPLFVTCQLAAVCCLLTLSKYTPGFIFLVSALMFLGLIFTRTMFHDSVGHRQTKQRKSKVE